MAKKSAKKSWELARMSLVELTPASYNPRKMTVEAFQGMGKSIEKFGLLIPIVWNKRSGNIVGGHQRFRYLVEQGEMETDVVVVDLDDNEEVALNIALNSKTIRGDFTADVVGLLENTEVKIGSAFNDVGLAEMFKDMSKRFEEEIKKKNRSQEPKPPTSPSSGHSDSPPPQLTQDPDAVITCPECRSRFKMRNNEVVFDSRTEAAE